MKYDPNKHHRRSIRLKEYDYSQSGAYFITLCAFNRECLFGNIVDVKMRLSPIGKIALRCWQEIPRHAPHVQLDEFVIMPNHIHGILMWFDNESFGRGVQLNAPTGATVSQQHAPTRTTISPPTNTLSVIVRTYKAAVTTLSRQNGHGYFRWQRNYYEHIIRSERDMNTIRQYIVNNPLQWSLDEENPDHIKSIKR